MIKDRVAFDLPAYDGLLSGHYRRSAGYARKRPGGTDDWLMVMTLDGEGRFGDLIASPPSLTLIAPGTTHDYGTASYWELLWVHFQPPPEWLDLLNWPVAAPGVRVFNPTDASIIENQFREVHSLSMSLGRRWAMNALERLLLLCAAQMPASPDAIDDRIQRAIDHIQRRLSYPLSISELADSAGLSVSRFSHLFREQTGMPPGQYILLLRLERGQTLLQRTALSVAEVANAVGMTPYYFASKYRSYRGISPTQSRRFARAQ